MLDLNGGDRRAYHHPVSDDSSEDLYGLAPDRFVPARAARVKASRAQKRGEEAREVGALRKPSVAAWAVNQLVRTEPKALQALFDVAAQRAHDAAAKLTAAELSVRRCTEALDA